VYYLSVQPDSDYFIWQLIVQINNFKRLGIEDKMIILFGYRQAPNPKVEQFRNITKATVIAYEDNRTPQEMAYIPSIRPYILKRFFEENQILNNSPWMYHDSDVLIRELPDMDLSQRCVYVSDTRSYLDSQYIKSKSPELFTRMCNIVKISPALVENNDVNCGGAQYVFSNVNLNASFWDKVMKDSLNLFSFMQKTAQIYSPEHPIQSWTADMWAILWNLWVSGYETKVSDELSFSWATCGISQWDRHKIFHNAGVGAEDTELFFKGAYIDKFPFNEDLSHVSKNTCSFKYVEEILDVKKNLNHFS
jgi:hypothetical protein